MQRCRRLSRAVRLAMVAAALTCAPASRLDAQMATADRLDSPGWWPTKGTPPRDEYVGAAACARCHRSEAASQPTTAMARTASAAADSEVLRRHPSLAVRLGAFSYAISTSGPQSLYTVSDGTRAISAPLSWAFGVGKVGQTFLFEREGTLFEARVSYYDVPQALGFTPTRALTGEVSLEEAMARPVPHREARRCFGCHATASMTASRADLAALFPGVTCEACHGPGRRHVTALERAGPVKPRGTIMDPGLLDPAASVDFCGACHKTFWDVKLGHETGLAALRSQPYRLQSSKCWGDGDDRLTCIACHDPHKPLVEVARSYDASCLRCHQQAGAPVDPQRRARACRVADADCVTCHMPKYDVPEMHVSFTDHLIRVVKGR
jgi:Cytochrome c554 and c-prime